MASSSFLSNTCFLRRNPNSGLLNLHRRKRRRTSWGTMAAYRVLASLESGEKPTRLVTFLGKGGSGKTTTAVIAAQHYANIGLRTCLAVQSQDLTSEYLLGCKIGYSTTSCNENLTVVRLETTKMILEPLNQLKKADARLNLTQGVLDGVVGEELGVLPGMDPILSLVALERWIEFLGARFRGSKSSQKFDVIVYDGLSSEETLRMIGASERARWYLKYFRSLTEKTDIGRLVGPSLLKLAEESVRLSGTYNSDLSSSEVWDAADEVLREASALFMDSSRFGCYLVMDPLNSISVDSALRYWGCAIQAGAQVSGAYAFESDYSDNLICAVKEKLSPLCFELVPHISTHRDVQWGSTLKELKDGAGKLFQKVGNSSYSSITFDQVNRTVSLFMPGFDKSEVKLFQYRGRSELLVEAGDQRRIIRLPGKLQGKVAGAKFIDRNLMIKIN